MPSWMPFIGWEKAGVVAEKQRLGEWIEGSSHRFIDRKPALGYHPFGRVSLTAHLHHSGVGKP